MNLLNILKVRGAGLLPEEAVEYTQGEGRWRVYTWHMSPPALACDRLLRPYEVIPPRSDSGSRQ